MAPSSVPERDDSRPTHNHDLHNLRKVIEIALIFNGGLVCVGYKHSRVLYGVVLTQLLYGRSGFMLKLAVLVEVSFFADGEEEARRRPRGEEGGPHLALHPAGEQRAAARHQGGHLHTTSAFDIYPLPFSHLLVSRMAANSPFRKDPDRRLMLLKDRDAIQTRS